ncbi:hypothetical protein RRG08_038324 [Elysia crispata]|uniref:Uncharacterized protein n=1 Tax=Elysia crispata TaxID=231223 RepID=A0AAE1AN74_9GAST|nr:hypothetical protein RRG08_038324 [Elysia crispata]
MNHQELSVFLRPRAQGIAVWSLNLTRCVAARLPSPSIFYESGGSCGLGRAGLVETESPVSGNVCCKSRKERRKCFELKDMQQDTAELKQPL